MRYEIDQCDQRAGHVYVAARFWFEPRDHAAGRPADLVNDFKLHVRAATALDPQRRARGIRQEITAAVTAYAGRAMARGWRGDRRGTTYVFQPAASVDDGMVLTEAPTAFYNGNSAPIVGRTTTQSYNGYVRFSGVNFSPPTVVLSANLQVRLVTSGYVEGSPTATIAAERASAPAAPTSVADFLARTRTTTTASWSPTGAGGDWITSPDLASVIQEVIGAYAPLTVIQIFQDNALVPGLDDYYNHRSWDDDPALSPKLTIDIDAMKPPLATRRIPARERGPRFRR